MKIQKKGLKTKKVLKVKKKKGDKIVSHKTDMSDILPEEKPAELSKRAQHMVGKYSSPRWSGEITDCSLPMTFDQYDHCSYNCLYCFSWFQKSLKAFNPLYPNQTKGYQAMQLRSASPKHLERIMNLEMPENSASGQFNDFVREKKVLQWGGLSDPFDEFERLHGVGLECLKILHKHKHPCTFSTKSNWWTKDKRYVDLFKGNKQFHTKVSIINLDAERAKKMEVGVSSPMTRLDTIKTVCEWGGGGATLRLRPFIIGFSDTNDEYLDLIKEAHDRGCKSISTEFFCLEGRAHRGTLARYEAMSEIVGFDIHDFYKRNSPGMSGYLRLNWKIKQPFVNKMKGACDLLGMKFYISDAHYKEKCAGGSCCGLPDDGNWNYARGQYTEMIVLAQKRKNGEVTWEDMEKHLDTFKKFKWMYSNGFNTGGTQQRTKKWNFTMYDYLKEIWNTPNDAKSLYKYFAGAMKPVRLDKHKNVVYKFIGIENTGKVV